MILKLICLGYLDYIDYLGYHSCHDMGDNLISSISGSHRQSGTWVNASSSASASMSAGTFFLPI